MFAGGDLLPSTLRLLSSNDSPYEDFIEDYLVKKLARLRQEMKDAYPRVFVIMGNDDGRFLESSFTGAEAQVVWEYVNMRGVTTGNFQVYGYSYVPPTPFLLKDWERYDVSRYVDHGSISPEEGMRSVDVPSTEQRNATIRDDLDRLIGDDDVSHAVFLFHTPPYGTDLDRAALDGGMLDHVPLDVHVGSIAVRRFIEVHQPLLTLHGHVHESARLTGSWRDRIGKTYMFSAAHDGPELAVVRFSLEDVGAATRELI